MRMGAIHMITGKYQHNLYAGNTLYDVHNELMLEGRGTILMVNEKYQHN